jgi:hypothetical protein
MYTRVAVKFAPERPPTPDGSIYRQRGTMIGSYATSQVDSYGWGVLRYNAFQDGDAGHTPEYCPHPLARRCPCD